MRRLSKSWFGTIFIAKEKKAQPNLAGNESYTRRTVEPSSTNRITQPNKNVNSKSQFSYKSHNKNAEAIKNLCEEINNDNYGEEQRISKGVRNDYERYWSSSNNRRDDNRDVEKQDANGRFREVHGRESNGDRSGNSRKGGRNVLSTKTMMNKLTEAQASLIECLKFLKIDRDAIVVIMLMIPKDEQIAEMAEFLLENPQATESDMLGKALELSEVSEQYAE